MNFKIEVKNNIKNVDRKIKDAIMQNVRDRVNDIIERIGNGEEINDDDDFAIHIKRQLDDAAKERGFANAEEIAQAIQKNEVRLTVSADGGNFSFTLNLN